GALARRARARWASKDLKLPRSSEELSDGRFW
ncbi:hypothetical protein A2U01_0062594, partial [Trifolium medium]|nr:hypothetical protein [Trifolium medium]